MEVGVEDVGWDGSGSVVDRAVVGADEEVGYNFRSEGYEAAEVTRADFAVNGDEAVIGCSYADPSCRTKSERSHYSLLLIASVKGQIIKYAYA